MPSSNQSPSLSAGLAFTVFGTIWLGLGIGWTIQQHFYFGGHRVAHGTLVTPRNHPIFFCVWLGFCFLMGLFTLTYGLNELYALFRRRRTERQNRETDSPFRRLRD